ncbi:MAG: hypothetical protein AABX25_01925 [Nanoarchaeota archaeon]
MNDLIKKDLISVFNDLAKTLRERKETDIAEIKSLSNHVIHNASVFQDEDSISTAILIYSLSKIIERKEKELDFSRILAMINSAISNLRGNNDDGFRKSVKDLFSFIRTVDRGLRLYINEVINQAQIKKGCKLCEHGISVARASEVLGISRWELMHYLGKTTVIDQFDDLVNISNRLKFARSLFE